MDLECIILIEVIQSHKKTLHVPLHLQNLVNNMYVCMYANKCTFGFCIPCKKVNKIGNALVDKEGLSASNKHGL